MKIKVLADSVINQIAAGEVVDRPSGVVRELVDNAIDAGATDIFVTLQGGGHSRLRVRDNGSGMAKDDAILAFERHATSKVSVIEDLTGIQTMGFRGEALASIAAVSKVHLRTRSTDSEVGTQVSYRGGKLISVQYLAWSQGTEVEVEHLFFNTPARRKFLKSPKSEISRIRTWLAHSSLAHPSVRYRLVSDGDELLNVRPVESVAERAKDIFSADLIPCQLEEGGIRVEAMISHPGEAISDTSGLVILVNGRLVVDKIVMRAIKEGFDSMLKDREFPVGYVSLELGGEFVDVNVHPQKSEVRFRHPNQVFAVVRGAVLAGIRTLKRPVVASFPVKTVEVGSSPVAVGLDFSEVSQDSRGVEGSPPIQTFQGGGQSISLFEDGNVLRSPDESYVVETQSLGNARPQKKVENCVDSEFSFSTLRYVGQILGCYLLCEWRDSFVAVDMHAAHERVNYSAIREAYSRKDVVQQPLLIPQTLTLPYEQVVNLMEQLEMVAALGFEIVERAAGSIEVRAVPSVLSHVDCVSLVKELAAEPVSEGWRERVEERIDHIAARIACHASVRSGDTLTRQEAYALFDQLDKVAVSGACPHGRPVVAQFSREAIERWFGRDR